MPDWDKRYKQSHLDLEHVDSGKSIRTDKTIHKNMEQLGIATII